MAIQEEALGPNHPDVATTLSGLAVVLMDSGDYERAQSLYERALTIQEKSLGSDHPDMADTLSDYADLLRKTDRDEEAERLEARAIAIREKNDEKIP